MGSSDLLSEAVIDDDSEKCYLPFSYYCTPRSHGYLSVYEYSVNMIIYMLY